MWWARIRNVLLFLLLLAVMATPGLLQTRDLYRKSRALEVIPHRSTFNVKPSGMKALYLLLQQAGFAAERLRHPLTTLGDVQGLLVLAPSGLRQPCTEDECAAVQTWLKPGNVLLLLTGDPGPDPTTTAFGVDATNLSQESTPPTVAANVQPVAVLGGVTSLAVNSFVRLDLENSSAALLPLCGDAWGTVLAIARSEQGGLIYVCSDAGLFSNDRLDQGDNSVLAVNLAGLAPNGRVIFDEYHQGYGERPSLLAYLWQSPRRWASLQLALALLLFLFSAGARFGRVVPEPPKVRRRDPAEYVRSMAGIFQSARATQQALRIIRDQVLGDIALSLGLPRQASASQVGAALGALRRQLEPEVRETLQRTEAALANPRLDDQGLKARALELARLRRKVIGQRTGSAIPR
jgi:hypothetical protein